MESKELLIDNVAVLVIDPNQTRRLNAAKWIKEMLLHSLRRACSVILISSLEEFDHLHLLSEIVIVLYGQSFTETGRSELTAILCTVVKEECIHYISYEISHKLLKPSPTL